ncbi:hypothetical protein F5I97DRAFT_1928286 [Phlebopus sp. FC_14]|nr:hypothetical protein F5I97DRAFT_1928286 [Phlebopus sp. FC_14]
MSDFHLVDPHGWEYDLQSVYSAYMGYFQLHGVPWYDRTWGHLFETFEHFLGFSWPVITVTDASSGRAYIVTRMTSIGAFLKMIKTRFGETLPHVDNMLKITPFETSQRHLRNVNDWSTYKKLHATLPAVALAAFKARVRSGDPKAIRELWAKKDKTFLAMDFEWSERNNQSCLEWGYAAARCGHLEALGAWPPVPETNYRQGHYIISEYIDKVFNKHCPTYPWQFGESQAISKTKLPSIIQSVVSLVSPDSETLANNLVLVGHGIYADIQRLEEMKIKLPHNILVVDTAAFERAMFTQGERGTMHDPKTGKVRMAGSALSLGGLLHSQGIDPPCTLHNAGNDAFMVLLAFQKLLDPQGTVVPQPKAKKAKPIPHVTNGSGSTNGHHRLSPLHHPAAPRGILLPESARNSVVYAPGSGLHPQLSLPKMRAGGGSSDHGAVKNGVVDLTTDEMGRMQMRRASTLSAVSPMLLPRDAVSRRASQLGSGGASGGSTSPPTIGQIDVIGEHAKTKTAKLESAIGSEKKLSVVRRVTMTFKSGK